MGVRLIKIAVVYFGIGVLFGMYMSITEQMQFAAVHAHINLLGWASLALAGIVYHLFPSAATTVLAKLHFWLHNIGLPVMMVGLALLLSGNTFCHQYLGQRQRGQAFSKFLVRSLYVITDKVCSALLGCCIYTIDKYYCVITSKPRGQ
jgi:cbb3-type cytochrome oxidase subunit 1